MHIKKRHIPEALEQAALLFEQGKLQQAGAILAAIVKADPRQAEALHLLGLLKLKQGVATEAELLLCRAVRLAPDVAELHNSLGVALRKQDKLAEAERSYRRCLKLAPDHVEALDNLGTLLRHRNQPEEAVALCRRAVRLRPDDPRLLANLAGALYEQGRIVEARKQYERAMAASPSGRTLLSSLGGLIECAQAIGDGEQCCRLGLQMYVTTGSAADLSAYLMRLNYLPSVSAQELAKEHRRHMTERYGDEARDLNRFMGRKTSLDRPLRIGYLSPDLIEHPVGVLLEPIVARHDRRQVSSVLYDHHMFDCPPKTGLKDACDIWRDCRTMPDEQLARLIQEDEIDILVDLAGHTGGNRLSVLARRVAPVQVSWLGYFNTTGLPAMDWLLADPYSILPGEEEHYTERIWRLPQYRFALQPQQNGADQAQATVRDPAAGAVFVSNNNLLKITPQVLEAWAAILRELPAAVLVVRWKTLVAEETRTAFAERFATAGGNPAQLRVLPPLQVDQLLASYADTDIMLDSFPFSGGITSLDALSSGVPVVALAGDRMAGRQTQAFLELIGHPELVAHTVDDYVRIAVDLASDPARLVQLRNSLRDDLAGSPLCDVGQFTRELETAYRGMWEDWCRSGTSRATA